MHLVRRWSRVLVIAILSLSLSGCIFEFGRTYGTGIPGGNSSYQFEADGTIEPCKIFDESFECGFRAALYAVIARFGYLGSPAATLLFWLDPIILQVPAGTSEISGIFSGPANGSLSITTVTGPLQVDATRQLAPEPGTKFLVIDFPGGVPPGGAGTYHFQFNFTAPTAVASPLLVKVLFAAKRTVGTQTYYSPLLPCTTNMADVPALTIPTSNMFTAMNITPFKTQQACNNMSYDLTPSGGSTVSVVEYRNSDFDHYFVTPNLSDIQLLDNKTPPFQAWSRTGRSFKAYPNVGAPAGSVAVCRFFNSNFGSKSSHFFALHGFGCEDTINFFPDWTLEYENYFNTMLPENGACAAGTVPLYRLYNQGMGGSPNHRFVTSLIDKQDMINQGWADEGVRMCLPT